MSGTVQRMRGRGTVQRRNERGSRVEKKVRGAGDGANKMSPGEDVKKRGWVEKKGGAKRKKGGTAGKKRGPREGGPRGGAPLKFYASLLSSD